ncbi:alpha-D-ribose 1-methylphosphonate 5-triphosphate diphosphatase [Roseicyclus persicicus]|uniref:Alpha-D-ribose 1-methylphosphonate 5-triphosphate diphosphatase n=1 Tax=Roseicyclus persicicus TaxID=2650661 RepID=A0A7X6JYZ2_9RHOB|nr:alpha-D-ribose 1-methylphosphonate 5-triphosphate diphosphatase [Roseibacterium persicicum]NKX44263.1 alpha-D-ribose 1-methylphosphonate 5-triphosphate diphosphatase [Roseibacterium persicicum]
MPDLPPLRFTGAEILLPEGFAREALSIAGGLIVEGGGREIDLTGYRILPGIVDLHGDGFERHMAPRRGAVDTPAAGLAGLDAECGASGITTAVLAQFWSWEGGMRSPEFSAVLAETLAGADTLTDLHLQLRVETHMTDSFDALADLVARAGVTYVVWNDHLPHKELAAGKRPPGLTGQALKAGRSPEAHAALLRSLHERGPGVIDALASLATRLAARGVRMGSHDDHTAEDRAKYRALGADICEFPETLAAAEAAKAAGEPVIMGAPNVVRGGSHSGKVPAERLVEAGLVDALVSDYHYPTLVRAAAKLGDRMGWAAAWRLVSGGPARLMGWDDRGRIAPGLRADLALLGPSGRVEGTICGGRVSFLSGALAARMLA